ncbi:ATP-binding protein [Actinomadura rugatobispora]|uniref:ATP-binding protein n=1 Tax=Actinomadura rugatobispora TaxID=1994 RepID=A0ABW1AE63_9ACTN
MGGPQGELPAEPSGFVGRERELGAVRSAVTRTRLVTLTGPGGVGKSRIALRAAYEMAGRFPDGVAFVELSGLRDGRLLADTVAAALGLRDGTAASTAELIARGLRDRRFLLVLDTCEHLVADCAELVRSLLPSCRRLHVLVTGRQPLRLDGESVLSVAPLPLPPPTGHGHGDGDALALFALRAAEADPGFTLGGDRLRQATLLCRRLDGIPLAIELAAAQLRWTPLDRLVLKVDGLFWTLEGGGGDEEPRHQTLRTTVGWSHELCAPLERLLWARLTVFAGGFDLGMAVEVCADERLGREDVAAYLAGLVEKSIVHRVSADRYDMLDTIREYGAVWLEEVEDIGPLLARHRDCVARLAGRAAQAWMSDTQLSWVRRLDAERDNIRAALEFSYTVPGEERAGLRLAAAMWGIWLCRSRYAEARYWLERGLALVPEPVPERAEALWQNAYLLTNQGASPESLPLVAESLKLADRAGDTAGYARALRTLGTAAMFMDDTARARRSFAEAVVLLDAAGLHSDLVMVNVLRAYLNARTGDPRAALAECDGALKLMKDAPTECWMRSWLGYVKALAHWSLGEGERCAAELRACLEMFRRMGDPAGLANCFEMLGYVYAREHRYAEGAVLIGAASRYPDPMTVPRLSLLQPHGPDAQPEMRVREELAKERFAEHRLRGRALSVDETVRFARGEPLGS